MLGRTIAILALSGTLIGFATSLLLPRRYVGRVALTVDKSELVEGAADRVLSNPTLSAIIRESPYYRDLLDYTPIHELVDEVRANVVIARDGSGDCIVQFTDDSKYAALTMTNRLVQALRRELETAEIKVPVQVRATGPSNALCALEGLAAGMILGLCVWFGVSLHQHRDPAPIL
jgi:hypothetical protein